MPKNCYIKKTNHNIVRKYAATWYDKYKYDYPAYPYWGIQLSNIYWFPTKTEFFNVLLDVLYHEYMLDKILGREKEFEQWFLEYYNIKDKLLKMINNKKFDKDLEEVSKKMKDYTMIGIMEEIK